MIVEREGRAGVRGGGMADFGTGSRRTRSRWDVGVVVVVIGLLGLVGVSSAPGAGAVAGVPGAPSAVTATGGVFTAEVSWTAGSDGGSPVTGWVVEVSPGSRLVEVPVAGVSSWPVDALQAGVAYSFRVAAVCVCV